MDFLDLAKHAQAEIAKADEEAKIKNQEWSKAIIPDDLASQIADKIYDTMKRELLKQCTSKGSYIKSDSNLSGDDSNYRYEIGLPESNSGNKINIVRANTPFGRCLDSYNEKYPFPKDNGYIYYCDHSGNVFFDFSENKY